MSPTQLAEISKLSVSERIQLVEDIWDTIASEPDAVPLNAEQRAILDIRIDEQQANPGVGRPWSDVRERILRGG
jgi:putative addiction module component (TIGR02574 family)